MWYLTGQIFILLALSAGLFFALGVYFQKQFAPPRQKLGTEGNVPSLSVRSLQELRNRIADLEEKILEKDKAIQILTTASEPSLPTEPPPPVEEFPAEDEARMLDRLTALQAALEAQGGILENKSAALEKARGQVERLREENEILQHKVARAEEKILALEADVENFSHRVPDSLVTAVDSLWANQGDTQWEVPVPPPIPLPDEEVLALRELSEAKDREIQKLQAALEELTRTPAPVAPALGTTVEIWEKDGPAAEVRRTADDEKRNAELGNLFAEFQAKLQAAEQNFRLGEVQLQDRIESKLDRMRGELAQMENLIRDATENNRAVPDLFIQRVESLIERQQSTLATLQRVEASSELETLRERAARLEAELSEKQKMLESFSGPGDRELEEERRLRSTIDEFSVLLSQKDEALRALQNELSSLSTKLNPELVGDDNLQLIRGIGPYIKKLLKQHFDIVSFRQIASLDRDAIREISEKLFFKGKIEREDWIGQAIALHFKKYNELIELSDPPYPSRWASGS